MFTKEGEKVPGFPSSVVPTLEEKVVIEHRPPPERTAHDDQTENSDSMKHNGSVTATEVASEEGRVDGELYGAPANADPLRDDQPPKARHVKRDADEEEDKAPSARATLRKNLMARMGSKTGKGPWSLPTPTPLVDPQGFEDPISDKFWKDVWVACAAHNVRICFFTSLYAELTILRSDGDFPEGLPRNSG